VALRHLCWTIVDFTGRYAFVVAVAAAIVTLSALHAFHLYPRAGKNDPCHAIGEPVLVMQGEVISSPSMRWNQTRFVLAGDARSAARSFHGRVLVTVPGFWNEVGPGDIVYVRGWPSSTRPPDKAHAFDERGCWAGQRVYTKLRVWSPAACVMVRPAGPCSLIRRAWEFHNAFRQYWLATLPYKEASLLLGMTLGARGTLPPEMKDDCIRAGVYHIVVVSGQNMSLIIGIGLAILSLLRVPKRWSLGVCALPIIFYTLAVGADPPVVRAASMAIVSLGVIMFRRDVPKAYPLAWAAAWILLREPEAVLGASFQLSFGATASLLWLWPERAARARWSIKRWITEAAGVALVVHIGIWPFLVAYFHRISLMSLAANWTIFPMSGALMAGGLFFGTWGVLSAATVPPVFVRILEWLIHATLICIHAMARCPHAIIPVPRLPLWIPAVYYGSLFGILFLFRRRKRHAENTRPFPTRWHRL